MKLQELFEAGDLEALMREIQAGNAPRILNATGASDGYAWGDLRKLGLAQKGSARASRYSMDEWWEYSRSAPGPITLVTMGGRDRVMQPGDQTDPIEIDYT